MLNARFFEITCRGLFMSWCRYGSRWLCNQNLAMNYDILECQPTDTTPYILLDFSLTVKAVPHECVIGNIVFPERK